MSKLEQKLNPYQNRDDAITWLRSKGIKVVDITRIYHTISFTFTNNMTTGKELDIIEQVFGKITLIEFHTKTIHVFTSADNISTSKEQTK